MSTYTDRLEEFRTRNDGSRKRLKELVHLLSQEDLSKRVNYGWTVAMALVHLAFWDLYAVARLESWEKNGFPAQHPDVEPINDALRPLLEAVPLQRAGAMAIEAAEAVDAMVPAVSDDLVDAIFAGGRGRALDRAAHRTLHLDDIESVIGHRTR